MVLRKKDQADASVPKKKSRNRTGGKTAKELVARHIRDEKDVITDDEFKSIVIEKGLPDEVGSEPLDIPADKNRPKDEDKDPKIMTPWDVISG